MADRDCKDSIGPEAGEALPALTVAELRDLIREHALKGPKGRRTPLRMPADEALAELAGIVNHWAEQVRQAQAEAAEHDPWRKAGAAAASLREVLPGIAEGLQAEAERGDPFAERHLRGVVRLFRALENFAASPPAVWRAEGVRDRPAPSWRHFAGALLTDLEKAFNAKLGRHDDGPAARLSARLFQRVTGEAITAARVGEVLRSIKS